jgi:hypothetical protein
VLKFAVLLAAAVFATAGASLAKEYSCSDTSRLRSLNGDTRVDVTFHNGTRHELLVFWIDYKGKPVSYKRISAGGDLREHSYRTHPFVFFTPAAKCVAVYVVDRPGTFIVH